MCSGEASSPPRHPRDALGVLADRPDAVVLAGSTDWGVEVNLHGSGAPSSSRSTGVPELRDLQVTDDEPRIGAALTLAAIGGRVRAGAPLPLVDQWLPLFASPLIRNGATLGGNLATASPIGDASPLLLALEA